MRFKIGDSFILSGEIDVEDDEGTAISDFTGWTGESWIADKENNLIAIFTFEWVNAAAGVARLTHMDTTEWPAGRAYLDITLTSPAGIIASTDTADVEIYEGPTGSAT